jgi:tRNA/tmRNA/rRNA uracil-C5-methylase (TrmA/RlmC/RlmD family)
MIPSALNLRLQQLEENISRVLQLLNEYEAELLDEDDPGRKSKYRRRVESLKLQKAGYEEEFAELQIQLASECPLQTKTISSQLQEIDNKIELLLDSQVSLSQALMLHFSPKEQELLLPFTQSLDEPELINIQAFLEAVETDQASEREIQLMLTETRLFLEKLQEQNPALPAGKEAVSEIINSPTIDAKHALKVSIPIIPFILTYEGELGLGAGINLKEVWQDWKLKFHKNR